MGGFTRAFIDDLSVDSGSEASSRKAAGESFARTKDLHGRLSVVMMALIIILALLVFLYLLHLIGYI